MIHLDMSADSNRIVDSAFGQMLTPQSDHVRHIMLTAMAHDISNRAVKLMRFGTSNYPAGRNALLGDLVGAAAMLQWITRQECVHGGTTYEDCNFCLRATDPRYVTDFQIFEHVKKLSINPRDTLNHLRELHLWCERKIPDRYRGSKIARDIELFLVGFNT